MASRGRRDLRSRRGWATALALVWRRLRGRRQTLDHSVVFQRLLSGLDPETGEKWFWRDPGFAKYPWQFVFQAILAAVVMLVILAFVQSLSSAAIAAGLASSVVGVFINPSNRTARIRSVVGGHGVALLLGSVFSFILFLGPIEAFLSDQRILSNLSLAVAVGLAMLMMAITNSEHPPAAGTALGMASREFDLLVFFSIIGAVALLAVMKLVLRHHLRDLT